MIFGQVTMVTVFSIGCKLNFAKDLATMCLHIDGNYHKLIVLLTYLCLGISSLCNTNILLIFRSIFYENTKFGGTL